MNFSDVLITELSVEQFAQLFIFINVFIFGMSCAVFFLLYQVYQLLKFVFSSLSSLIKRRFSKSNN